MFSLRKTRFYWRFKVDSEEQVWVFSKDLRVSGNQLFSIMPKYTLKVNIKKKKKKKQNQYSPNCYQWLPLQGKVI